MTIPLLRNFRRSIYKQKLKIVLRSFKSAGNNVFITKDYKLKGTKYITIGNDFYGGPGCRIEAWDSYEGYSYSPEIVIGDNVKINSNCHIGCINRIKIGDNCLLGSNVFISDHSHGNTHTNDIFMPPVKRPLFSKGEIVIEENCWLCESCVILPNVHIGKNSIVGANAVVTSDVPSFSLAVGNPAVIKPIKNYDNIFGTQR